MASPLIKFDVTQFVKYDEETNKSICLQCGRILAGKKKYNIIRHYRLEHKLIIDNDGDDNVSNEPVRVYPGIKKKTKIGLSQSLRIDMGKKEFLKCCVGLVTIKSIAFRIFDDNDFFKKIIKPYENKFNIDINSTSVAFIVERASQEIKEIISEHVENKMVCLNVDIVSRMGRTILGVNIQFMEDYKICIETIGMIEITKRHTAQLIKNEILRCLQDISLDTARIYPIAGDNNYIEDYNPNEKQFYSQIDQLFSPIKCVSYNLQSVAQEVLKTIESQVNVCRQFAKELCASLKTKNISVPNFQKLSRWNTSYHMINFLLSQKEYIKTLDEYLNVKIDWYFIENFTIAFKPVFDCCLKSQSEQYILTDFYRDWLCCELELQEISSANCYARFLYNAMTSKKVKLFENATFLSVLYLDPRFNFEGSPLLTYSQKKIAKSHLLEIFEMCQHLGTVKIPESKNVILPTVKVTTPKDIPSTSKDSYDILAQHIEQMITTSRTMPIRQTNLKQALDSLCDRKREPLHINVLEYWKIIYKNEPELYQLGQIILAIPATQISKERTFNGLNSVLTMLGKKYSRKVIENVLLCKLNFALLQSCDFEFVEKDVLLDLFL